MGAATAEEPGVGGYAGFSPTISVHEFDDHVL